ncbi:sodium-dependent transporter [Marinobacter sp. GN3S48]|uniref:sodium-dependent transporter n=1 Tax=Marinobacter sp. GN3S48 TaxID=3382302 RepID=UPI00387AC288
MSAPYETPIGSWTRQSTFFWAAVGATVGLANLWQFPYLAGQHGGGLFILLYLACLLLVTLPLMVTESAMGRHSRHGIVLALDGYIRSARCSRWWMYAGRLSIIAAFLVLSYTAVFGSIALAYVFFGALGVFNGAGQAKATAVLADLVSDTRDYRMFMAWHLFFLVLVVWVSIQGVVKGLERVFRALVPASLLLLLALFALAGWHDRLDGAVTTILEFRPEDVGFGSFKAALFHAFFTLGLGMGVWSIFGAYTPVGVRLKRSVLAVVLMDTLIAILAGVLIFATATAGSSFDGERGFSLLFVSLPVALAPLPGSQFIIAAAFLLVVLVVWTTSLALLEPVIGWFREWTGSPRGWSAFIMGALVWFAGLGTLLSFNIWGDVQLAGGTLFRWLELITGGLLIPLVAILIALFTGWCLTRSLSFRILGKTPWLFSRIWYWVMRLVLPVVVAFIGISYTLFSLDNLCDSGEKTRWCRQLSPVVATPGKAPDTKSQQADAPQESEPAQPASNSGEARPARHDDDAGGDQFPEKAPKQDNILYHSV